ncbi:signal peptidase I [Candidatus Falkowbacteria bacterium]|nr:signal peptidase I [Candidatus Falkowbacteria bacterium]
MFKNFFIFTWELVKIIIVSLAIIIPIRYFLIQPFYVKGASMEPSFYDHEYLIIDEISYRLHEPKRGEVIVFRYPRNPQEYFIKRVVGLPGEKVQIKNGEVYVYNKENSAGFALGEPYLGEGTKTYGLNEEVVSLDSNEFFVLGDNRNSSKDSRSFGPVNRSFITGRVLFRGWPFNRAGLFEAPAYQF